MKNSNSTVKQRSQEHLPWNSSRMLEELLTIEVVFNWHFFPSGSHSEQLKLAFKESVTNCVTQESKFDWA